MNRHVTFPLAAMLASFNGQTQQQLIAALMLRPVPGTIIGW
jgi:hypothetical protein